MASSMLRRIARNVLGSMDPIKKSLIESKNPSMSSSSSPLLMLPPSFEDNIMNFNFYSFAEDTIQRVRREREGILANDNIKFVSSSHGWLALFNRSNCDLFLFNPFSGRQIKLPPIHTLDIHKLNLKLGRWCVTKVVTSCSPEERDCHVMLSFGPHQRLAFCSPTSSSKWTPIGDLYYKPFLRSEPLPRSYMDFIYSSSRKLFYCTTNYDYVEAWDIQDTGSPKIITKHPFDETEMDEPIGDRSEEELALKTDCKSFIFLVGSGDDLFCIRRYLCTHLTLDSDTANYFMPNFFSHGSRRHATVPTPLKHPYKTIGFDVYKYDPQNGSLVYMDGSLDGLAFFIGNNHSFAISPRDGFPEFQSNSIYFTDFNIFIPSDWLRVPHGGHDIGIFNYENRSFSPCYYPCDFWNIKRIIPPPMWFTPTD